MRKSDYSAMLNWREATKIDKGTKIPLYYQIGQNLRQLIMDGWLEPGSEVLSEWELSDLYGVSRLTVRRALDDLTREGLLTRRHGVGTFVSEKIAQIVLSKLGFSQKMREIGRTPTSRIVSQRVLPAADDVAAALRLQPEELVIELVRIRYADGEPIMLETAYLSHSRFNDLADADLGDHSLYEFLQARYQVSIIAVDQILEPTVLTAEQAKLLEAETGSPAMASEVIALIHADTPIEYSVAVTRGDKSRFIFHFREGENSR